ncbi:hypothetical protein C0992_004920 [Termitomyces sp. T32_za158]|nr:hypothetical protein C0992_004920 [Termitomyces sp. T32_za158]
MNKVNSITNIVDTVGESTLDAKFRSDCIEHNIALLNSIKKESRRHQERAEEREATERERDKNREGRETYPLEPYHEGTTGLVKGKQREGLLVTRAHRDKLAGNAADSGSESELDGSESKAKKQKIREDELPWYEEEKSSRADEDVRCQGNRELLQLYLRNPSFVKQHIAISRSAPSNYPMSEWDQIIKGEPADFDVIYSAIHHVGTPRENRGRFGDCEFIIGNSDPIRKVEDHGQWTVAATLYGEALGFAWPGRKAEWATYYKYIVGLFSAKPTSLHPSVIKYDKAVRS